MNLAFFEWRVRLETISMIDRRYLEKFFELSTDLFMVVDHHGVIQAVNKEFEIMTGYREDEMVNEPLTRFIHPDDVLATQDVVVTSLQGRRAHQFHNRYVTKAGSTRWVRWQSTTHNGHAIGIGQDVTEERESKLKLEDVNRLLSNALKLEREWRAMAEVQQERFRDLFNQAPMIAAVFTGADQTIELANPSFYALVNFRHIMGRSVAQALPMLDDVTKSTLTRVYETGKRFVGRNFSMKSDWEDSGLPSEKLFHLIFEPIIDKVGSVEAIWCLAFDVTETVQLETKLRSAERMASLGEMAAGIGHEINNPLAYSLLNLDLMGERLGKHFGSPDDVPEPIQDLLKKSVNGLDRVRDIVKGLKAFSRHDESSLEPIDIAEPLRAAIDFTTNETRHRAKVTASYTDTPLVVANAGRLTQVFTNLLVNSAQAMDLGKANENSIHIRVFKNDRNQVIVDIQDTGCGIPQAQIDKVFEPFFTSKPVGVGTGLGLSICHGIIASFGGDIQIASEVGKGTKVRIILPGTALPAKIEEIAAFVDAKSSERKNILVIDDDKALRDVIVTALENDHDVTSMESAVEALEHLDSKTVTYDWVICDVMMPAMTGMEFFETIRARGTGFEKKIILMTGGAFTPKVRNWMEALSNPKLQKPFRMKQLKELLDRTA